MKRCIYTNIKPNSRFMTKIFLYVGQELQAQAFFWSIVGRITRKYILFNKWRAKFDNNGDFSTVKINKNISIKGPQKIMWITECKHFTLYKHLSTTTEHMHMLLIHIWVLNYEITVKVIYQVNDSHPWEDSVCPVNVEYKAS